jgi:hypothetical protein
LKNKLFTAVDIYDIGDNLLVIDKDKLYTIGDKREVKAIKLPIKINNIRLSVGANYRIAVWGDDGIGNTFYVGKIGSEDWERIWLSDTNKKVDAVTLDYRGNVFITLKDETGVAYQSLINKKIYTWNPPRNTPAIVSLSEKSNTKNTFLKIEQSDNLPIQVTKELKQTCRVNFIILSEYKGIENEAIKFNHTIDGVSIESQNFEPIKLTPVQFKSLLDNSKVLQELGEIKYKTMSYESFRVERDAKVIQPPANDFIFNDYVEQRQPDNINGMDIVRVNPNIPTIADKPIYKG